MTLTFDSDLRHIYDWNIVNCDVKQPIQLNNSTKIYRVHPPVIVNILPSLIKRHTMVKFLSGVQGQSVTDTLTHGRTEPQQHYFIPFATRCAGIIKFGWQIWEWSGKNKFLRNVSYSVILILSKFSYTTFINLITWKLTPYVSNFRSDRLEWDWKHNKMLHQQP